MIRFLFTDDDPMVLGALRRVLRRTRREWTVDFVESAHQALEALADEPYDVIVSDMRMPSMDGATLLSEVARRHPGVVRIILSGQSDQGMMLRAVQSAHQFLAKPFEAPALLDLLDRAASLRALLGDPALHDLVGGVGSLPSVPRTYQRLSDCLLQPEAGVAEVVSIVEEDGPMTAKILQMVNSAFFGLSRKTTSIQQAVGFLGFRTLQALALTVGVFEALDTDLVPGFSLETEQQHAIQVGRGARLVAGGLGQADEAFVAGMLHDVGKLILAARRPDQLRALLDQAAAERRPLHAVEAEHGISHARIGAYLLGIWGLSLPVVEAVAYHHDPGSLPVPSSAAVAVHVANGLVRQYSAAGWTLDGAPEPHLDEAFLAEAGVEGHLPEWRLAVVGI